jgi:hypothetical protein
LSSYFDLNHRRSRTTSDNKKIGKLKIFVAQWLISI